MTDSTPMHCDGEITYDAFLTHSSKDAATVERVMQELEDRGIKCCYSKRDLIPGHNLINFMQDSVCKSSMTIAFISKDFLESPYCQTERDLALQRTMEVGRQVLIPILVGVQVTELPLAIRGLTCLSLDQPDFQSKLLTALRVQDSDNRPTYQDMQQSVVHERQLLEEKEELQRENAALKEEMDELKHLLSFQEQQLREKYAFIQQLLSIIAAMVGNLYPNLMYNPAMEPNPRCALTTVRSLPITNHDPRDEDWVILQPEEIENHDQEQTVAPANPWIMNVVLTVSNNVFKSIGSFMPGRGAAT